MDLGKNTEAGSHSLLQGSSCSRDQSPISHFAGGFFTIWATTEAHKEVTFIQRGEKNAPSSKQTQLQARHIGLVNSLYFTPYL